MESLHKTHSPVPRQVTIAKATPGSYGSFPWQQSHDLEVITFFFFFKKFWHNPPLNLHIIESGYKYDCRTASELLLWAHCLWGSPAPQRAIRLLLLLFSTTLIKVVLYHRQQHWLVRKWPWTTTLCPPCCPLRSSKESLPGSRTLQWPSMAAEEAKGRN